MHIPWVRAASASPTPSHSSSQPALRDLPEERRPLLESSGQDALHTNCDRFLSSSDSTPPTYVHDLLSRPSNTNSAPPNYANRFQDQFLTGDQEARPNPPSKTVAGMAFLLAGALASIGLSFRETPNRQYGAETFFGLAVPVAATGLIQTYRIGKYYWQNKQPLLPTTHSRQALAHPRRLTRQTASARIEQEQALLMPPMTRLGMALNQLFNSKAS